MLMIHALTSVGFAKALFWIGVVALLVVQGFTRSAIGRFYARLRRRYPDVWMDLGRPILPRAPRLREARLAEFLRGEDFLKLRDPPLNTFYSKYVALRKVSYVPYAICAAGVLLFALDKLLH